MPAAFLLLCCTALAAVDVRGPGYLGIVIDDAATSFAQEGIVILRVEPGSPAEVMGLTGGDRLVALDGQPLQRHDDWRRTFTSKRAGDRIDLDVARLAQPGATPERLSVSGVLPNAPPRRRDSLSSQLAVIEQRLEHMENESREPTLGDILRQLRDLERDLPRAAAAFKRVYPQGEFRVVLSVEITSDKTAAEPLAIEVGGASTLTPTMPETSP